MRDSLAPALTLAAAPRTGDPTLATKQQQPHYVHCRHLAENLHTCFS